jgi:hypothetical protein
MEMMALCAQRECTESKAGGIMLAYILDRIGRSLLVGCVAVALVAVPVAAQASPLVEPVPGLIDTGDDWYAVGPNGEQMSPSEPLGWKSARPASTSVVSPFLLDPVDAFQCNVSNNASHTVTWWTAKKTSTYAGGRIDLKCGTATTSGYKHIKARHQTDWQNRVNQAGGGTAWDDLLNFSVAQAFKAPSSVVNQGSGKICYTTPIRLYKSNGTLITTYYPRAVLSSTNKILITAFPGGGC